MSSFQTNAPKDIKQDQTDRVNREAGNPSDQQDRISYGEITKVIPKSSQVHVKFVGENRYLLQDKAHPEGKPVPVIQPLRVINHLYGRLHRGMKVRIFWIGKNDAKSAFVEVIGADDFNLEGVFNKEPEANRQDTLPYLSMSGGVLF